MYCPTHFQENRPEIFIDLIKKQPLATIIRKSDEGLVADHIPLMYEAVAGTLGKLVGHVAKMNPLWQAQADEEHLIICQGPAGYVSPNWYVTKAEAGKVVPTWNYVVLHVHATLRPIHDPQIIYTLLKDLTEQQEAAQPKPWKITDAPADFTDRLVPHIVGIEFTIRRIQGKWKLSQNQTFANRRGVVDGLRALQTDAATEMAALVQAFGDPKTLD